MLSPPTEEMQQLKDEGNKEGKEAGNPFHSEHNYVWIYHDLDNFYLQPFLIFTIVFQTTLVPTRI